MIEHFPFVLSLSKHSEPLSSNLLISIVMLCATMMAACDSRDRSVQGKLDSGYDFNAHIGWLHGNCLAIKAPGLKRGTKLSVVSLGKPQVSLDAEIIQRIESGECYALRQERKDVNSSEGNVFYTVVPASKSPLELAIGIIGLKDVLRTTDGTVHVDLNGDGHEDYFTECSTSEGVQFNVWSDAPYKNKALWSAYYYLGYDTEPNCPKMTNQGP
jgi:hypothetical protein